MHDPRAAFRSLLEDPKLDDLVARAKAQAAKLSTAPETPPSAAQLDAHFEQSISKTSAAAVDARATLRAAQQAKIAERAEKVELAKHIVKVAASLLAA